MKKKISLFQEPYDSYDHDDYDSNESANYHFKYDVKHDYSSNEFGHEEWRDGDKTEGKYYVLLPNGVLKIVDYKVDGYSGFIADVTYEGSPEYDSGSYGHNSYEYEESSEEYDDKSKEYGYRKGRYDYDRR